MGHVVGIPLRKGNNHETISCEITSVGTARDTITEGMAVSLRSSGHKPVVDVLSANPEGFIGFIHDINPCNYQATLIRASDLVCLPTADQQAFSAMDPLTISSATGLIDPAGDVTANGFIADGGQGVAPRFGTEGRNGKTGEWVAECVLVSFGSGRALAAVAP